MKRLLYRRQDIVEHGALAEFDLGVDLHSRRKPMRDAVALEYLADQFYECLVARGLARGSLLRFVTRQIGSIGTHVRDLAFDHAVFLKRKCSHFHLDRLAFVNKANIVIRYPHFGA